MNNFLFAMGAMPGEHRIILVNPDTADVVRANLEQLENHLCLATFQVYHDASIETGMFKTRSAVRPPNWEKRTYVVCSHHCPLCFKELVNEGDRCDHGFACWVQQVNYSVLPHYKGFKS